MEIINRDFASMMSSSKEKKSQECFLDVVGADVDGSFRDSLTYLQTSSVAEVSIGGQIGVKGGQTVQIAIRDENVLLNLDKTKLCFRVRYESAAARATENIPLNTLMLFRPTSCQLGSSLVWNCSQAEHYVQQRLLCRKPDEINARALCIPITPAQAEGYARADRIFTTRPLITVKQNLIQMTSRNNDATFMEFDVCIALSELFPEVRDTFSDGFVYIGNNQHLVMNLLMLPTS
jgi:hypothetical protein